jgi:hypothetical protein
MCFRVHLFRILPVLCVCILTPKALTQHRPGTAKHVLAVQLPAYWTTTTTEARQRCKDALTRMGATQPSLLKPFEIFIIFSSSPLDSAFREHLDQFCPKAEIIAAGPLSDGTTTLSVPTNRVLFSTNQDLPVKDIAALLPDGAVLNSTPNQCCTFSAHLKNGRAIRADFDFCKVVGSNTPLPPKSKPSPNSMDSRSPTNLAALTHVRRRRP